MTSSPLDLFPEIFAETRSKAILLDMPLVTLPHVSDWNYYSKPTHSIKVQAGKNERLAKTLDSFVTSFLITEGLKAIIREDRPNHDDTRSFPSEHTTAAFSIAAVQAHYDPKSAILWYAGATAIGVQRFTSNEHHIQDVVAGAAIGYFTAQEVLRRPRGLLITPMFSSKGVGVNLAAKF